MGTRYGKWKCERSIMETPPYVPNLDASPSIGHGQLSSTTLHIDQEHKADHGQTWNKAE